MKKTIFYAITISQLIFFISLPIFRQLFAYLHPVVIIVLWMCITTFVFFTLLLLRKQSVIIPRYIWNLLLLIYSLCLFILLFFRPGGQVYDSWNLVPFSTISFYLTANVSPLVAFYNLAANIGLFIPFGFALMLMIKSKFLRLALPILAISGIELLQFMTQRGSLDIDDLILNLIGVYIGYLFTPIFLRVVVLK